MTATIARGAIPFQRRLAAVAILAAGVLVAGPAAAQKQWALGTSSTGSGPYVNGVIIANAVNGAQNKLRISAQTTGGYNENLALVASGRMQVAMNSVLDLEAAYTGTGKFEKVHGKEVFKNLRSLFGFSRAVCHFLTRADSGIKSITDIKGRKVNLNTPATFTRGLNEQILKALNIREDEIKVFGISTGKHFDAIQDRVIDVGMHCYSIGFSGLQQLAATTPIRLLDMPDDAFKRLNDHYHGLLAMATIPANTYSGQTQPVKAVANVIALFVNKDANPDDVYAFTDAFWKTIDQMAKEEQGFVGMTPELGRYRGAMPMHPGAVKWFDDHGVK